MVNTTATYSTSMNSSHGARAFITPEDLICVLGSIPPWLALCGLCCEPEQRKRVKKQEKAVMISVIFERGLAKHFCAYLDKITRLLLPVKGERCPAASTHDREAPPPQHCPIESGPCCSLLRNPASPCHSEMRELQ